MFLSPNRYLCINYEASIDANNTIELFALWILMKIVVDKEVCQLQILGYSKLVVDWFKGEVNINIISLSHLLRKIMELESSLELVTIEHIYREFNTKADLLSKEAVSLPKGFLICQELRGGRSFLQFPSTSFKICMKEIKFQGLSLFSGNQRESLCC